MTYRLIDDDPKRLATQLEKKEDAAGYRLPSDRRAFQFGWETKSEVIS